MATGRNLFKRVRFRCSLVWTHVRWEFATYLTGDNWPFLNQNFPANRYSIKSLNLKITFFNKSFFAKSILSFFFFFYNLTRQFTLISLFACILGTLIITSGMANSRFSSLSHNQPVADRTKVFWIQGFIIFLVRVRRGKLIIKIVS